LKVDELKVGMMLQPSLNKWTQMYGKLRIKDRSVYKHRSGDKSGVHFSVKAAEICARPVYKNEPYYDYAIYMGSERGDEWFDGCKKYHLLLVGSTLARISGYEFRYLEEATSEK
tara:strand:+ start:3277 stop:3618 length:342 start_codon:yes stop_codon:yes gene_type:complete